MHLVNTRKIKCNGNYKGCEHCVERGQRCLYQPVPDQERRKASLYKRRLKIRQQGSSPYLEFGTYATNHHGYPSTMTSPDETSTPTWLSPPLHFDHSPAYSLIAPTSLVPREIQGYFQVPSSSRKLQTITHQQMPYPHDSYSGSASATAATHRLGEGQSYPATAPHELYLYGFSGPVVQRDQCSLLSSPVVSESASDSTSLQGSPFAHPQVPLDTVGVEMQTNWYQQLDWTDQRYGLAAMYAPAP